MLSDKVISVNIVNEVNFIFIIVPICETMIFNSLKSQ